MVWHAKIILVPWQEPGSIFQCKGAKLFLAAHGPDPQRDTVDDLFFRACQIADDQREKIR
jgi:hypothetical protein